MKSIDGKWPQRIIALQRPDGGWGHFHTLAMPDGARRITTEQALRRLRALGLTKDDPPIRKALGYMRGCLRGDLRLPDTREKVLNWDAFEAHMLAAWIRAFVPDDPLALPVARFWAERVAPAFVGEGFDTEAYRAEYRRHIPALHSGERLIMPAQFYMVSLLRDMLDEQTERRFVDFLIQNETGVYYVYDGRIADPPADFASKRASHYLAALELLAGYRCAAEKLSFAAHWLRAHRDENGEWDMGAPAKDGVYFPLADAWRKPEDRRRDCTLRITRLLSALG